ncbi:MAG: hypothetical protein ABI602_02925 [Candidatus Saccharibacteria bacterium]
MKKSKSSKKFAIILLLALSMLGIYYLIYGLYHSNGNGDSTSARVTEVIDRPNFAEDGYYGFEVIDSNGKNYSIDADPYLDVAPNFSRQTTEEVNRECLDVPKLRVNDEIEFNLPSNGDHLTVCFEKGTGHYFLRIR